MARSMRPGFNHSAPMLEALRSPIEDGVSFKGKPGHRLLALLRLERQEVWVVIVYSTGIGLMVELQQNGTVMQQARNELRPELAFTAQFGRDSGTGSITKRGSELVAGITLTSPFQRRKARGEVAIQAAKQAQLMHKLQFVRDKVVVDVHDAVSALELALRRLELARAEFDVARRLGTAEMERFQLGGSTLFIVNQREVVAAYAQYAAIAALTDCHIATAAYRAATATL